MNTQALAETFGNILSRTVKKSSKDNELLTVAFTSHGATLLHVELGVPHPKILHYSVIHLDPSMTENERRNAFLNFLSSIKTKNYPRVAITWSDGMTFRQLNMPGMPPEDLQKAFDWDLKKKYYYNPDENHFGYSEVMEVEGTEGPEKLFNVFYCDKKFVGLRLSFIQGLGLEIRSLVPGQAALANFIGAAEPTAENDVLVCDLEETLVRILVVRENRNMLVRQVTLAAHEFNLTDEILVKIAEEIKKTIDYYESQKHFRPVTKVVLVGNVEDGERIHQFMAQHIETKIVWLNMEPFLSSALSAEDKNYLLSHPGVAAAGLGAVFLEEENINLVPDDIKTKNRERRLHQWLNIGLVGLGLTLSLVVGGAMANLNLMKSQIKILQNEHDKIEEKKKALETILDKEKVRRAVFKGEIYSPSLLKELSYRTPAVITLSELQYNRRDETLVLQGRITDAKRESIKSVSQYATNLSECSFFTSATVSNTNQDEESKTIQFEVTCVVKGLL